MSRKEKISRKQLLRTAVKTYYEKGYSLIPIKSETKRPALKTWKTYQNETMPKKQLLRHLDEDPTLGIGIVTGKLSGIVVVDLDSKEAQEFAEENGFPKTPTVKTARGYHLYYAHPGSGRVGNFQKRDDLPGIDLRGDGGYIVAPPSIHETGVKYKWVKGKSLDDLQLAQLPEILLAKGKIDKAPLKELLNGVKKGHRNAALISLAGLWVKKYPLKVCLKKALEWNKTCCEPPEDEDKVIASVESIWKKEQAKRKPPYTAKERKQALKLLKSKDLTKQFLAVCRNDYIGREKELLLVKLATITRHLEKGVSLIVIGQSSVGKSQLIKTVLRTVWEEGKYEYTSITPKFLDYLTKHPLKNRILYVQEAKGLDGAQEIIKLALSEGNVNTGKLAPSKKTGFKTHGIKKSTKGLVILTTTTGESFSIGHELDTRLITFKLEHDDALVRKSLLHKGQIAQNGHAGPNGNEPPEHLTYQPSTSSGSSAHKNNKSIYRIWQVADNIIKKRQVVVLFAVQLSEFFPTTDGRFNRDFDKVISLIKASALLHQYQRERDADNRIIATISDYKLVYSLRHLFANFNPQVPNNLKKYIEAIKELSKKGDYPTRKEVQDFLIERNSVGTSVSSMKRYRTEALKYKLIKIVSGCVFR